LLALVIIALLVLAQDAHWPLDGDAGSGEIAGRAEFRDSGIAGKALVCNGVDTLLRLAVPPSRDWTLSLWVYAAEPTASVVWEWGGLALGWMADGRLAAGEARSEPGRVFPGQWIHVGVTSGGERLALHVNGELAGTAKGVAGERRSEWPVQVGGPLKFFRGLVDEVRFRGRAATAEELAAEVDAGLPWARTRPRTKDPFPAGKFALERDDVVAFLGGQNLHALVESGRLEAWMSLAVPGVRFRNLAWEGDTVFEQRRDLHFGPWKRYLERSGATVLVVQYGQMESLRGEAGVADFVAAYGRLLTELAARTRRIVVLSPARFEKPAPPLPDLSARNADLARYAAACEELAYRMGLVFVDLRELSPATRNGVHWTAAGLDAVGLAVARAFQVPERPVPSDLLDAVREKNRLWYDHWRPMNWAFLEGDRTEQPSGRDHVDRRLRWFPVEMQDYLPLLRRQESRIEALVK
jgi:hypothetical protein